MTDRPPRCAVLGQPIAHSLSPVLHRAAYAALGLEWTYEAIEVGSGELDAFLGGLDQTWRGLSLTMPLKREVIPLLDALDDWALLSGAANTVVLEETERQGFNTDIPGALAALAERGCTSVESAVVLGGGATATSLLLALRELGLTSATVQVREPERAQETVDAVSRRPGAPAISMARLGDPLPAVDIVVSTIPASAQTPSLVEAVAGVPVVFEVVYDPWPTPLATAATGRLVSGLDLLVHQAVLQVGLMTGRDAPVSVLRAAGEAALRQAS